MQQIVELERANYAAILPIARVTPGLSVILRDDVIIISSETFPTPDTTHACLLQATPERTDRLIAEVTDYFEVRSLAAAIYLSPACVPADLPEHLARRGFVRQEAEESWLVLDDLLNFPIPGMSPRGEIRQIEKEQAATFAAVFMEALQMPVEFAPYMAQLMEPSVKLDGVYHYLAFAGDRPIGTCSLICHENFGILGSAGVLPEHRKGGAATNLAIQAAIQARARGVDTLMLQTTAGTWLERLLCMSGFKKVFVRACYTMT